MFSLTVKVFEFAVAILNLVPPTRIELVMTGYQPIVIPFNYRGIFWWTLIESNYLPATPLINGYRVTAGNGEQDP